jgi:hypothetical protein
VIPQFFGLPASMILLLILYTVRRPCRIGQRIRGARPAELIALLTFFSDSSGHFLAPTLLVAQLAACYQPERRHT